MSQHHLLQAIDLIKHFPGVKAVDGISFEVDRGTCFGLLGPNGAGKTTTMEMLERITSPDQGEIRFQGQPLAKSYSEEIGIQFQSTALQDFQTVIEALQMFASLYPRSTDLDEIIQFCDLQEILDRDTHKLSGGQRQRLLLAIALVNDPQLVFLDEPTTGLDPQARRNFWALIEQVIKRGKTVILTTHYMEEAQRLCDEIVIVDRGRIIARGVPDELLTSHLSRLVIRLPESAWPDTVALPDSTERRNGYLEIFIAEAEPVIDALETAGADLTDMKVEKPNLEDLFLKLTGHGLRN